MAGLAHEMSDLAVHAYQNRLIGNPMLPIMAGYKRCSGGIL